MAVGMEKNSVCCLVAATVSAPNNVMVMPSRQLGDFLVADGADTVLFFPQVKQLSSLSEVVSHFEAKSFLKIDFPIRVIGIGITFDFRMPFDRSVAGITEPNGPAV